MKLKCSRSCLTVIRTAMQGVFVVFWCYVYNLRFSVVVFFLFGSLTSITNCAFAKEAFAKVGKTDVSEQQSYRNGRSFEH
jgi:hypothetical protein